MRIETDDRDEGVRRMHVAKVSERIGIAPW